MGFTENFCQKTEDITDVFLLSLSLQEVKVLYIDRMQFKIRSIGWA